MTSEVAKTISTCAIWLATCIILTFWRISGDGFLILMMILAIVGAAATSTAAVWRPVKPSVSAAPAAPETSPKT